MKRILAGCAITAAILICCATVGFGIYIFVDDEYVAEACEPDITVKLEESERPFALGFTNWPPDTTETAVSTMQNFLADHGDITAQQLDGGVPWVEAFANAPLHENIIAKWEADKTAVSDNHLVFLSVNPLNDSRVGLAPYWGENEGMDLPAPWDAYTLDDPAVKTAFLNYTEQAITHFEPDYLAIGIETNVSINNAPEVWEAYKELHQFIYTELKKTHPSLPIFGTITLHHLRGLDGADAAIQQEEVAKLMPYNDIVGVSVYPYGWFYYPEGKVDPVPDDYFDLLWQFDKPIAITETGAPSRNFKALGINYQFDQQYQYNYLDLLLKKSHEHNVVFIINWTSIDFEKLLDSFPITARQLGKIWAYTGLQQSDGCAKKALSLWDGWLALPRVP